MLGIIIVPVGVPAAFTFFMLRAKQRLGGVVNQTDFGGAKLSPDDTEDSSDTYGFLTKDYRPAFCKPTSNLPLLVMHGSILTDCL